MKAVSNIITVILIVIIASALASLLWIFLSDLFSDISGEGTVGVGNLSETLSSCMKIDSIFQNKIYLRNCGEGLITNDTINVYLDDGKLDFSMSPESISKGEFATISLDFWGLSLEEHRLKITNPKKELEEIVESVLHDSCVLALDFDEGEGDKTYDSSGYGNDGTLEGDTSWTNGKYGKALKFDGSSDYVDSGNINFGDSSFSGEAWIKTKDVRSQWSRIFGKDFYNPGPGGYFWFNLENGFLKLETKDNGTNSYVLSSDNVSDGNWHHVFFVVDRTNNINKIYIDGKFISSLQPGFTGIFGNETSTKPLRVGGQPSWSINGTIDEVRVFKKNLTPEETILLKRKLG